MANRRKPTTLPLGTLAEATCKPDDWIDGLRYHLERIRLSRADRTTVRQLLSEYDTAIEANMRDDADQDERFSEILQELCDIAEQYLPAYTTQHAVNKY